MKQIIQLALLSLGLGVFLALGCGPDRPGPDDPRNEWDEWCQARPNCGQCAGEARCGFCNAGGDARCYYYSMDDDTALGQCGADHFARITEDCELIGEEPAAP